MTLRCPVLASQGDLRWFHLERQKAEITACMAEAPADVPDVHPNFANVYRKRVAMFTEALHDTDDGRKAAEALRGLIGEIILLPGEQSGEVHAELRGELFRILDLANPGQSLRDNKAMTKVEARDLSLHL